MLHTVVLYSRQGCHICEIVEQLLQGLQRESEFTVERIDISTDPLLLKKYGEKIPVVIIDDRKILEAPIHFADLRAALKPPPATLK